MTDGWSVIIAPSGEDDLVEIGRYTQELWGIEQRDRYLRGIADTIEILRQNPYSGVNRDYWYPRLRSVTHRQQYYIIFMLNEAEQLVQILRILHTRRDIPRIIHPLDDADNP